MKGAISFKQVSKIFPPDTHAITDVNLDITEGEFMTVVGPSGCGKSTLLRMVAGLESPTSGKIEIFGKDAKKLLPQDRDLGMVFQNYALFPHLSVFDNIAYGLKVRHQSLPEIHQKVDRVAQKLEIADTLKRKPHQLSGGQRQRVALGRLLARDPGIHLFDEPLGNLDPQFRTGMRAELARLHQENPKSTLYVTHDQAEAMTLGHRICVLCNGRVLQIGTPEQIYQEPAHRFVATFLVLPVPSALMEELKDLLQGRLNLLLDRLGFLCLNLVYPTDPLPLGSDQKTGRYHRPKTARFVATPNGWKTSGITAWSNWQLRVSIFS